MARKSALQADFATELKDFLAIYGKKIGPSGQFATALPNFLAIYSKKNRPFGAILATGFSCYI